MKKVFLTFLVALFATVLFGSTRTEIKPDQLPQCVKDWVAKNLPGYTIDKAFKIETTTGKTVTISYLAKTIKTKAEVWVSSDPNCTNIKKVTMKEAQDVINQSPPKQ